MTEREVSSWQQGAQQEENDADDDHGPPIADQAPQLILHPVFRTAGRRFVIGRAIPDPFARVRLDPPGLRLRLNWKPKQSGQWLEPPERGTNGEQPEARCRKGVDLHQGGHLLGQSHEKASL